MVARASRPLVLVACVVPVEAVALSVDAASVRLSFTQTDTFRLAGLARGLSLDGVDTASVAVDRFAFSIPVDHAGGACAVPSDCPGGGSGSGSCFEYVVGLPGDQNCAQMGGSPAATYCGTYGTCGMF